MNSNWKLLSAGLLVAALAGCGGGGGGEMTEPEPEPTPEQACLAGDGVVYEDGVCKTAEDLRNEGRDAEAEERDQADADEKAAADAKAAQAMAKSLLAVLSSSPDTDDPSTIVLVNDGYDDADMKDSVTISLTGEKFSEEYDTVAVAADTTLTSVSTDGKAKLALVAGDHTRVVGDAFSKGALKTHTLDKVRIVGGTSTLYFSTPGSYHGVMGTYECTGTCTSIVPASNTGLTLAGDWTFTPSNPDAPVTDADGLQYGWWATETAGSVSVVRAFYAPDSLVRITGGLPNAHGGGATYKGSAKGQYAIHRGTGGMNDSGSFTADAELKATFGESRTMSGTIDGFMGADGEMRDWTVMLGKVTHGTNTADGEIEPNSDGVYSSTGNVVWTIGDDASAKAGEWQFAVFGTTDTGAPSAAAGGFQASHAVANGHMIGAFGAERE